MKKLLFLITLALATPAYADCYVDYKAKQDDPLRLHYGVVHITSDDACGSSKAISANLSQRLGNQGWQLLNVMSVFEQDGLKERKKNAGQYYLRF